MISESEFREKIRKSQICSVTFPSFEEDWKRERVEILRVECRTGASPATH